MFSWDTYVHRPYEPPTIVISLWITIYTCHSYIQSYGSWYYKMPWTALRCSENPLGLPPCSSYHLNTPMIIFLHLSSIRSSSVNPCNSQKFFEMLFDLLKILSTLLLLKFLPSRNMVNSIYLVIFVGILCLYHFESVDSIHCECPQSSNDPYESSFRLNLPF